MIDIYDMPIEGAELEDLLETLGGIPQSTPQDQTDMDYEGGQPDYMGNS